MLRTKNLGPEHQWNWQRTWSSVEVNRQSVSSVLGTLFTYNFTLPKVQINRGTVYVGGSSRLRRVVRDLLMPNSGRKELKVAVIGGSVSWGQFTSKRGETDWFSTVAKWMIGAFPRVNITARNGCTPGVPTPYMIMCLELSVDPDVDLVFMEYTLNDGLDPNLYPNRVVADTERLVRRILDLPGKPAVVFMHVPTHGMAAYEPRDPNNIGGTEPYKPFYMTAEDAEGALAHYYDVQYLSLRTATYRLAAHLRQPGFRWEDEFVDQHPGDHGHKIMADLAVHLIQRTALGLLFEPLDLEELVSTVESLPPPMYPGNVPPDRTTCSVGDAFKPLVVLAEGFEYINEGTAEKPKPGYVTTTPGSRLRIKVDTDRSGIGSDPNGIVNVYIHHLRSYQHMGCASIECVSGCLCIPIGVNAKSQETWSQVYLSRLSVTQSKECIVQVTVVNHTYSGEHKFKVTGVVVAERAGAGDAIDLMGGDNRAFMLRQHLGEATQVTWTREGRKGGWDEPYKLRSKLPRRSGE
ncbi:hypothetical protein HYH03_007848 [Edaphochlamys debaryana]|uniref:SGNH hydrolase-type esterase domain-containing protein n=1 Tax=Edaphochlamys debaryana TaxID=47281 RepID=A0A835Y2C3_9CHLO|nr:hypothetical protein HYH03_007848 [Edaphochlamys debaryana]|eukprot:KAG2493912.1 hypothetical protein HYH03_007848 [Edaphochlamys debaryana]